MTNFYEEQHRWGLPMWPHHPPTSMLHHPKQFLLLLSDRVAEQGENESGPAGDVTTEPQRQKEYGGR